MNISINLSIVSYQVCELMIPFFDAILNEYDDVI